jgi:hypothetical protein
MVDDKNRDNRLDPRMTDRATLEVTDAAPCVRCGYDLRATRDTDCCPECGLAVPVSRSAEAYVVHDHDWLRRLALGARMGGQDHPALLTIVIVSPIGLVMIAGGESREFAMAAMAGCLATIVIGFAWIMRCVWLVTTRPSIRTLSPGEELARILARVSAIVVVVSSVALSWDVIAYDGKYWILTVLRLGSPFGFAGYVGGLAFGVYCRRLFVFLHEDPTKFGAGLRIGVFAGSGIVSAIGQLIVSVGGNGELGGVLIACATFAQVISGVALLKMPRLLIHRLESLRAAVGSDSVAY